MMQSVPKHDQLDKDEMRDSRLLLIELQEKKIMDEPQQRG